MTKPSIIDRDKLSSLAASGDQQALVACLLLTFFNRPKEKQLELIRLLPKWRYKPSDDEMVDGVVTRFKDTMTIEIISDGSD